MARPIVHFEIPADDPEALAKFYTELLDWTIEKMPGPMEYWMINTGAEEGGPGLNGGMMARQAPEHVPMNYVQVDSADEHAAKATELGATVVVPKTPIPGMGAFVVIVDPQGNCLGLWEDEKSCCER